MAIPIIPAAAFDVEMVARRGFAEFVRRTWPQADTSPLKWNWHHDAICEHLEAVHRREVKDLAICCPPGSSKSLLVSVLFPSWVWILDAEHRWITTSYDRDLVLRDSRKHRKLIESTWFQERWPHVRIVDDRHSSTAASLWANTEDGIRCAVTIGGGVTGKHGDTLICDDPLDTQGAARPSGIELDKANTWLAQTASTRFRDPTRAATILVMQRLHANDPAGAMLARGATMLNIPMRFRPSHLRRQGAPPAYAKDPRTEDGELLQPKRFDEEYVAKLEITLGPSAAASQLQQDPANEGGLIFRKEFFRVRWTELPEGGTWAQSWDCKFKDAVTKSWVVGQAWYHVGSRFYLVWQVRGHWGLSKTIEAIKELTIRFPKAHRKLIEDKANGTAVIEMLRDPKSGIPGIEAVEPEGGKETRANAVEPLFAADNVILPHTGIDPLDENRHQPELAAKYPDGSRGAPWVTEYIAEHLAFPTGAADDQVDATTQYLNKAATSFADRLRAAMANMAKAS